MNQKENNLTFNNYYIIIHITSMQSAKYSQKNKYSSRNNIPLANLKEDNKYKSYFKNSFKHKNKFVKLQFNHLFLLFIFIFMNLLSFIITQNPRNLDSKNIIYLTVEGLNFQPIINPKFEPYLIYLNDIETEYYYGSIYIDKNGKNKVTLVFNSSLEYLDYLFDSIKSIIEIDLSNFDSSKVSSMKGMFNDCTNLKAINFNNFNTSLVNDMSLMFSNCESLVSLNLSNFDTSKVTTMEQMFYNCLLLTSLNLSNFITPELLTMNVMFYNCKSLKNIDISNIKTSKVIYMGNLFGECKS